MPKPLIVTPSPHFRSKASTQSVMRDVLIALMPALIASVVLFGARALTLTAVCTLSSVLFEYLYRKAMKLDNTVADLSAAVTGVLLAFNLPVTLPYWMAVIGCFIAVVVVKQLFGGLGKNFANPAIVGRIVLVLSFGTYMSGNWTRPRWGSLDAVTSATQLDALTTATPLGLAVDAPERLPGYLDMLLGNVGGCLGETCALALLLGGIYLVLRRVITPTTPLAFLTTVAVMTWALGADPILHLLSGGLMLGAVFMATDYVTTPTTELGKVFFGLGCGVLTVVIRLYSSYVEGVSFAILIMNIVTPHIDHLTRVKAFGGAAE